MQAHQREFIDLALDLGVLRFGEFKLKSGRISPYFFNAGLFNTGRAVATLGRCYAQAIASSGLQFDMLFGPAYKGIPLVTAAVSALAQAGRDVPFAFNRKEAKAHGEGGNIIGSPLAGGVLIVDDVITAGTAIRESVELIDKAGARLAGVVLALDRQERGQEGELSAVQEVEARFGVRCVNIVTLADLIESLAQPERRAAATPAILAALRQYRERHGAHYAV